MNPVILIWQPRIVSFPGSFGVPVKRIVKDALAGIVVEAIVGSNAAPDVLEIHILDSANEKSRCACVRQAYLKLMLCNSKSNPNGLESTTLNSVNSLVTKTEWRVDGSFLLLNGL